MFTFVNYYKVTHYPGYKLGMDSHLICWYIQYFPVLTCQVYTLISSLDVFTHSHFTLMERACCVQRIPSYSYIMVQSETS